MNFIHKILLQRLLKNVDGPASGKVGGNLSQECKMTNYNVTRRIPVEQVRQIYARRYHSAKHSLEGFPELLLNLSVTEGYVRIHSFPRTGC
jgi:hypothetical protein